MHLKTNLKKFIEDLYDVIKIVDRYYDYIRIYYVIKLNEIKQRFDKTLEKKTLYRDFIVYIILQTLREIDIYYKRFFEIQAKKVNLSTCIDVFR